MFCIQKIITEKHCHHSQLSPILTCNI